MVWKSVLIIESLNKLLILQLNISAPIELFVIEVSKGACPLSGEILKSATISKGESIFILSVSTQLFWSSISTVLLSAHNSLAISFSSLL